MAATSYYHSDDYSSDESSDWSDSPRTKRKTTRKTKSTSLSRNASAKGGIKKAKKPGRKPLETFDELPSDPKLKRKVQNRAAQRAFRERKEQFVVELQGQLKELEAAKEKREKELQKDITQLKRENEKLKQEMDELKKLKFPPDADKSNPTPMISPPITDDQLVSSPENNHQDDSFYYYDKTSDLSDYQGSTPMTDSLSSISGHPFSSPTCIDPVPELDFDAFNTFNNDPLQSLFGTELDLFGNTTTTMQPQDLDPFFVEQMQALTEQDTTTTNCGCAEKPSKKKILYLLNMAKGANRKISQLDEDFKVACPEGSMDHLCGELRKKIAFDRNHIMTDDEVDLYIECIKRNN